MNSNYAKENISTEQSPPREKARLSGENGDQERTRRSETPPREGAQKIDGSALLNFGLSKATRLRKRAEFLRVYAEGKRFDGRLMTAFVLPLSEGDNKLGVTATKKGVGKAHDRNRAKRLLRETFRLSKAELGELQNSYEWVLNARRNLPKVKLEAAVQDFRRIISVLKKSETEFNKGEERAATEISKS